MTRLSFKKELYLDRAVSEALQAFAEHAQLARSETDTEWLVDVQAAAGEQLVVDELSNYTLGLTIELRGAES